MGLYAGMAFLCCQTIWTVDAAGGPGVNFTDIPPAIAAASDGDILLVANGIYSAFSLTGKGLRILGSGSGGTGTIVGSTTLAGSTSIAAIPAASLVYIDRVRFLSPFGPPATVQITGATTTAVLADFEAFGPPGTQSGAAVRVSGAQVHIHRGSVNGAPGGGLTLYPDGGNGLVADALAGDPRIHLVSSSVSGGPATVTFSSWYPVPGGHAAAFVGSGLGPSVL